MPAGDLLGCTVDVIGLDAGGAIRVGAGADEIAGGGVGDFVAGRDAAQDVGN
jgi:hypothetical protein